LEFIERIADHACMTTSSSSSIVLRRAVDSDSAALDRLAQLDSRRLASGAHLVAERDGVMVAALAETSGVTFSDPFSPTADAVHLLRQWARQRALVPARRAARRPRFALAS
jgi:hypothetical protein